MSKSGLIQTSILSNKLKTQQKDVEKLFEQNWENEIGFIKEMAKLDRFQNRTSLDELAEDEDRAPEEVQEMTKETNQTERERIVNIHVKKGKAMFYKPKTPNQHTGSRTGRPVPQLQLDLPRFGLNKVYFVNAPHHTPQNQQRSSSVVKPSKETAERSKLPLFEMFDERRRFICQSAEFLRSQNPKLSISIIK